MSVFLRFRDLPSEDEPGELREFSSGPYTDALVLDGDTILCQRNPIAEIDEFTWFPINDVRNPPGQGYDVVEILTACPDPRHATPCDAHCDTCQDECAPALDAQLLERIRELIGKTDSWLSESGRYRTIEALIHDRDKG